jgi:predicted metal-dependent hydrolase
MLSCSAMQLGLPFATPVEFYFVRHRRARRYVLRVDDDGRVRVTIPRGGSRRDADAFARRHIPWIEEQRARIHAPAIPVERRTALRAQAARELPALLQRRASQLGLTVARVSIRNQRSRWGSCGPDGHITLNWRLMAMPEWVRDYVIVHELMHLRRLDHSPAYWTLVETAYPGYRQARAWLKVNGASLR